MLSKVLALACTALLLIASMMAVASLALSAIVEWYLQSSNLASGMRTLEYGACLCVEFSRNTALSV